MRIISGIHRGRKLEAPKGTLVRPTSDFAREAIFNILMHGAYDGMDGKRIADICCGTGAMGLEALSRGAVHATFVDLAREAIAATKFNIEKLREEGRVQVLQGDATQLPLARAAYDLVFVDPPYGQYLLAKILKSLSAMGWLKAGSLVVAEHGERENLILPEGYTLRDERRYGKALVKFLEYRVK